MKIKTSIIRKMVKEEVKKLINEGDDGSYASHEIPDGVGSIIKKEGNGHPKYIDKSSVEFRTGDKGAWWINLNLFIPKVSYQDKNLSSQEQLEILKKNLDPVENAKISAAIMDDPIPAPSGIYTDIEVKEDYDGYIAYIEMTNEMTNE